MFNSLITRLTPLGTQDSRIAIQKLRDAEDWVRRCGISLDTPCTADRLAAGFARPVFDPWAVTPFPPDMGGAAAPMLNQDGVNLNTVAGAVAGENVDILPTPAVAATDPDGWRRNTLAAGTSQAHECRLLQFIRYNAPGTMLPGAVEDWVTWCRQTFLSRVAGGESAESARRGLEVATRHRFGLDPLPVEGEELLDEPVRGPELPYPPILLNETTLHATLDHEARLFRIADPIGVIHEEASLAWRASGRTPGDWLPLAEEFRARIRSMQRQNRPITQDQHDLPRAVRAEMDLPPDQPYHGDWLYFNPERMNVGVDVAAPTQTH